MKNVPSVTTRIRGGLGNQLFMYAMGRRLSLVNEIPLYLEIQSGFEDDYFRRTYGLNTFSITGCEISRPRSSELMRLARIATNQILPFLQRGYYSNFTSNFDRRYLDMKVVRPIYLDGYWQDERYFSDIRVELKNDLTFIQQHNEMTENLAREMRSSESVAVHVRQLHGVPAGSEKPNASIESLPNEYYRSAVQSIKERRRDPKFYLFSDSTSLISIPALTEENVTRVDSGGADAQYEDLYLMSQCRHFVLANSTYSWWGTWLGRTSESIIVSPVMREWNQYVQLPGEWHSIEWARRP